MTSDHSQTAAVAVARATVAFCLVAITVGLGGPLLVASYPAWATVAPAAALAVLLLGLALGFSTSAQLDTARRLSVAAVALGGVSLVGWTSNAWLGPVTAGSLGARWLALAPPPLLAAGSLALGLAIAWRRPGATEFDVSAAFGTLACALFFLLFVGHLYQAPALTTGPGLPVPTGTGSGLLLLLSVAALFLHPAGPVAGYAGADPGAVAKRRLLPAAVLTPMASGFLLVYALDGDRFSPTMAVALTVFANVLVMLVLINAAGNKVARVVWDRQRRMEAREAQVRKQGLRDSLTQLLNRRGWDAELEAGEKRCRRDGSDACVMVIDLDGLKQINDSEGHKAGDSYIHRASAALRQAARKGEPLARLGGDEFAYLVTGCDDATAREIVSRFEQALLRGRISASVGYAMRDGGTLSQAFEEADAAMYEQKRQRKRLRA